MARGTDVAVGLLALRVALGLIVAAHGAQKLFGWFGGGGPEGTASYFAGVGFRAPRLMGFLGGLAGFGGGLLFAAGLATPLGALAIVVLMLEAIATVQWPKGFWTRRGGYEYNLVIVVVALAVVATGPGELSLDHALGWASEIAGLGWAAGVLVLAAAIAGLTLAAAHRSPASTAREPAHAGE
ncbi:MAG: DoxX family protein [Solirubrobacteraceae bacterium]